MAKRTGSTARHPAASAGFPHQTAMLVLLAAVLLLTASVGLVILQTAAAVRADAAAPHQAAMTPAPAPLRIDYLSASWCTHCAGYEQEVREALAPLGAEVRLRTLTDEQRKTDPAVAAIYEDYRKRALFAGFPALVSDSTDSALGGREDPAHIFQWACGQFERQPDGCAR